MGTSVDLKVAADIDYDPSLAPSGLISTNVQAAIDEVALSGGSGHAVVPDVINSIFTIGANKQLIVFQRFTIEDGGRLVVAGRIVIL